MQGHGKRMVKIIEVKYSPGSSMPCTWQRCETVNWAKAPGTGSFHSSKCLSCHKHWPNRVNIFTLEGKSRVIWSWSLIRARAELYFVKLLRESKSNYICWCPSDYLPTHFCYHSDIYAIFPKIHPAVFTHSNMKTCRLCVPNSFGLF